MIKKCLACLGLLAMTCATALAADAPGSNQPTVQQQIDEAVFRSHAAFTQILLDETADATTFSAVGDAMKQRGMLPQAANAYLIALRINPKFTRARYQLACAFTDWGQNELAMRQLTRAVDDGFWGWRLMIDDNELQPIRQDPGYAKLVERVKSAYDTEAPKHRGGQTVRVPAQAPADATAGYPVIVFMHGMGSNRAGYEPICDLAAKAGLVGISLDGSIVADEDSYVWDDKDISVTHNYIQAALDKIKDVKIDRTRVFVAGFSQGANRAAALLVKYPTQYRGAIANGCGGERIVPDSLPSGVRPPPLYMFVGSHEHPLIQSKTKALKAAWESAGVPVERSEFEGGHQFPPNAIEAYRQAIDWLLAKSPANPGKAGS
jgi:predicted esterase